MRALSSVVFMVGGLLIFSCGSGDDDDAPANQSGGFGNTGTPGFTGGRSASSGGSPSTGSGGTANTGTVNCLATPMTGNICPRDGVCQGNPSCSCVSERVQCGGQNANGGAPAGGISCGQNPQNNSSCTGGPGTCPNARACTCTANGTVTCTTNNAGGRVGAGGSAAGGRAAGGRSAGGSAGRALGGTDGGASTGDAGSGSPEGGSSVSEGGTVASGGTVSTAGSGGSGGAAGVICPANPTVGDLCAGGDGVCPSDPACFCIGASVQGTNCGS